MRTTYRRCPRCQKIRPSDTFHGRGRKKVCRPCAKLAYARRTGRDDVAQLVADFGDLDVVLTQALGSHWPRTLVRAREGVYARF